MKKLLFLIIGLCVYSSVNAQGVTYTPYFRPSVPPLSIPNFELRTPQSATPRAPSAPSVRKIGEEILREQAYSIKEEASYDVQIREISYSDGTNNYTIIGVKKAGSWESVNLPVNSLSALLSRTDMPVEHRGFFLTLSEHASHIAITDNNDILLIGGAPESTTDIPPLTSQETNVVLRITQATVAGVDRTNTYKEWGQKIYIYLINDEIICLSNKGATGQSWGVLSDVDVNPQGSSLIITGTWHWRNTYDSETGSVAVSIRINSDADTFTLEMKSTSPKSTNLRFSGSVEKYEF